MSLDLYSRLVLGWAMGHRLTMELAEQALTMALANRSPRAGLRHHSDRGSPYAATDDHPLLGTHGIITSMSRTGNGGDNACVESVFGTLTRERVYPQHDATRDEARQDIFESIELFDIRKRRHSIRGSDSPAEYEARTAVASSGVHGVGGRSCHTLTVQGGYNKSGQTRIVPFNSAMSASLTRLKVQTMSEFVFTTLTGKPYDSALGLSRLAPAPVWKASPHTTRHSFATRLIDNEVDLRTVQELGGWSSLRLLERWIRRSDAKGTGR